MPESVSHDLSRARERLLVELSREVTDERVLDAIRRVPRELFVPIELRAVAYENRPLMIGYGQTISQPCMVARMTELCELQPTDRVLEVGAGCGYQTAVLARLCHHVYALELIDALAEQAKAALAEAALASAELDVASITLRQGDGSRGWAEHAPFDSILVAAGAPAVPTPLVEQLADGGRLVIPVGRSRGLQVLQVHRRSGESVRCTDDTACRFVDLQGEHGWS